jgi:hypothetical protein
MTITAANKPWRLGPVTPGLEILSPNEADQELYDRSPELLTQMTFWHLIGSIGPRGDTELRGFEDPVRVYEARWREGG